MKSRLQQFDLIEAHLRHDDEALRDYASRVFGTTRASYDRWRKGEPMSSANAERLKSLYEDARRWDSDLGRKDPDHRRRATAAINLLEGRPLKMLADLGVAFMSAQEDGGDRQQGAELALEALAPLLLRLQSHPRSPASA